MSFLESSCLVGSTAHMPYIMKHTKWIQMIHDAIHTSDTMSIGRRECLPKLGTNKGPLKWTTQTRTPIWARLWSQPSWGRKIQLSTKWPLKWPCLISKSSPQACGPARSCAFSRWRRRNNKWSKEKSLPRHVKTHIKARHIKMQQSDIKDTCSCDNRCCNCRPSCPTGPLRCSSWQQSGCWI